MAFSDFVHAVRRKLGLIGDVNAPSPYRMSSTGTIEDSASRPEFEANLNAQKQREQRWRAEDAENREAFKRMNADPMGAYANADQSVVDANQQYRNEYADQFLAEEQKRQALGRVESARLAAHRPAADKVMAEYFASVKDPAVLARPESRDALERLSGNTWRTVPSDQPAQKKTVKQKLPSHHIR